tara:strand:- start:216 stop:569 length:354 start_codon:yes stop_codon:yes gene_type:complete
VNNRQFRALCEQIAALQGVVNKRNDALAMFTTGLFFQLSRDHSFYVKLQYTGYFLVMIINSAEKSQSPFCELLLISWIFQSHPPLKCERHPLNFTYLYGSALLKLNKKHKENNKNEP